MSASEPSLLRFAPFSSTTAPVVWTTLTSLKIDRLQLDEAPLPVRAHYGAGKRVRDLDLPPTLSLDSETLGLPWHEKQGSAAPAWSCVAQGTLKNFNTIEAFKSADKAKLFADLSREILEDLRSAKDPLPALTRFLVLCFADLKKYRFYHWFAVPALVAAPAWRVEGSRKVEERLGEKANDALHSLVRDRLAGTPLPPTSRGFFLVRDEDTPVLGEVMEFESFFKGVPEDKRLVGFVDPSTSSSEPGWPLRNLLSLLAIRFGVKRIGVLCFKDDPSQTQRSGLNVVLTALQDGQAEGRLEIDSTPLPLAADPKDPSLASAVGWERNASSKLAPKVADLGPLMDPARLADQAVDLNLKLMRWRIMPSINLDIVRETKCLLLGAGTLGCYVARTLMGWGVRHITLLDSAKVSYSNPVRQPLFDFADCLEGGKPKAECAAAALKRIYPGITARGVSLSIPMPGHPLPSNTVEQTERDVQALEALIEEHDVVYLLMDSRESRWLPSVIGAAKGKLVINAALGFDTYLVMRHGGRPDAERQGMRLGCYFCNDIVAPADSLTDRTLDQMCTVTRPGLAAIAGASAVELMVSVLQHKEGVEAPAPPPKAEDAEPAASTCLGVVPHQIRGYLARFNSLLISGRAYDRCTACSAVVVDAYRSEGFGMLRKAFDDEAYLERLSGLEEMKKQTEELEGELNLDWSEEEDE